MDELPNEFTVGYWRKEFESLNAETEWSRIDLVKYDGYFLKATGKDAVRNVKNGVAGLQPTMRVVNALKQLVADKQKFMRDLESVKRRQKLVVP